VLRSNSSSPEGAKHFEFESTWLRPQGACCIANDCSRHPSRWAGELCPTPMLPMLLGIVTRMCATDLLNGGSVASALGGMRTISTQQARARQHRDQCHYHLIRTSPWSANTGRSVLYSCSYAQLQVVRLITERGRFNAGFRKPSGQETNLHRTTRP
jgi:hypothetical protein